MDISEIRVKLIPNPSDRLKAFCSVTLDGDFVIRDIKIIDGTSGTFVAMPSRKLADRCPGCGGKNHLRARFCNDCGQELDRDRASRDDLGRTKLHADIAHPINTRCRTEMQERIVEAFKEEIGRADEPGYEPAEIDGEEEGMYEPDEFGADDYDDQEPSDEADDREFDDDDDSDDVEDSATDGDYGTDDYNALIEDLKRTSGEKRQKPRAGTFSGRQQGGRSRDNNRRDIKKQDNSRGRGSGRRNDRAQTSEKRDQRGGKRDSSRSRDDREHKHRDVAKPVAREFKPAPPPVAPPPPPPVVEDEGDDFGAGIL